MNLRRNLRPWTQTPEYRRAQAERTRARHARRRHEQMLAAGPTPAWALANLSPSEIVIYNRLALADRRAS